jgi:integrase
VRLHIEPRLGSVPLAAQTTERINMLYRELERSGRADHHEDEGFSPRTVRCVHTILSAALAAAVKSRPPRLAHNPAAAATPPTAKDAQAPEMHPWTAGQLAAFLAWAREHADNHALWHTLAMTGARRREALALRWRDIGLDAATVSFRRSAGILRNAGQGAAVVEARPSPASPGPSTWTLRPWPCCGHAGVSAAPWRCSWPETTRWCSATWKASTATGA